VVVCGATGATGRGVVQALLDSTDFALRGALAAPEDPAIDEELAPGVLVTPDPAVATAGADVVIDFSAPEAPRALVAALAARPIPAVIGTTGLSEPHLRAIEELSEGVPVVLAPNMGLGVNVLRRLVRQAAAVVGSDWDAEIVEIHHRRKKDAPSGTALALAGDVLASTDEDRDILTERSGLIGPRTDAEIGVQSLRGGDVVGEHTVMFVGHGERIELVHRATDRTTFAAGALRAARWLLKRDRLPGLYSMDEVLFT